MLNGHDHNYQRYHPLDPAGACDDARGLREFVVGTGGRAAYSLDADDRRPSGNSGPLGRWEMISAPNAKH